MPDLTHRPDLTTDRKGVLVEPFKDSGENTEGRIKLTKSLIKSLLQAIKAYRLYNPDHPTLSTFLDRLKKDFEHYFEIYDSFILQVGEYQFLYQENVVYEDKDLKGSLAFLFFKDGIREIHFFQGLEYKELEDFLDAIRQIETGNHLADDLVTLLWEKDFNHIDFTTVIDFLEESGRDIPETYEELLKGLEYSFFKGESDHPELEQGETPLKNSEELKSSDTPSLDRFIKLACALSPEEIEEVSQEVDEQQQPSQLYDSVIALIEILLHLGENKETYKNLVSYLIKFMESLISQGEISKVVAISKVIDEIMNSMVLKDKQTLALQSVLDILSSPHSIEQIGKAMVEEAADSESIIQYFHFLKKQAIDPLCYMLMKLNSEEWRKFIYDRLIEFCKDEIEPLTKHLSDPNPFFVFNILSILEKIKHPATPEYLGKLVIHEDTKIRWETLQLLSHFGGKGVNLVKKLLTDASPKIRAKASFILAKIDKNQAEKVLTETIHSEDFFKREFEEKSSFFMALGGIGSKEALSVLEGIAKKRKWFKGEKWSETQLCAANVLKVIDPERLKNLSEGKA
jgi:hypothetical protein